MKKLFILLLFPLITGCGCSGTTAENNLDDVDPQTVVEFKDEAFETMIREIISKEEGDIFASDMEEVYEIELESSEVKDLTGLEYAKNLDSFQAYKTNLKSLEPIRDLANLERLTIRYLELEDPILKFSNRVNLNYVLIIETNISDLSFLKNMTNLTSLNVSRSGVTDISPIANLNDLEGIDFNGNDIKDLTALKGKNKITRINLQSNENLVDIEPLKGLTALEHLTISYTKVVNLKPLESLPSLRELVVYKHHNVKHLIFDQISLFENKGVDVSYHR